MKAKLTGLALFAATLTTVSVYPSINPASVDPAVGVGVTLPITSKPVVDVVFVLDTTGSMSGLLQAAKEKIWSIATTMTSAQQVPDLRIGLVAFRDRGDDYVTRVIDLSDDLDSVYAALMDFEAGGGGDGPESVNKALYDAVHKVSWSQDPNAYQAIFLVGDAPPHMDYQDEAQYPEILTAATQAGLIVNSIQCGQMQATSRPWQQIASLGGGRYFQVEQGGSAIAIESPFDTQLAELSARLDATRLYYGSKEEKAKMQRKVDATSKLNSEASVASRARRGAFNASVGGRKNLLGDNELVDAVVSGTVDLDELEQDSLPAVLKSMAPAEQKEAVSKMAVERQELEEQIQVLAKQRDDYLEKQVEALGNSESSLDHKLYEAVQQQAAVAGLEYKDGPDY